MREMSDISLKYRKSDVPTHSKGFEGTWVSFLSVSIIFSVVKRSETVISDLDAEQATRWLLIGTVGSGTNLLQVSISGLPDHSE